MVVRRPRDKLDEADGDVAVVLVAVVEGLERPEAELGRGAAVPVNLGRRVGAPHLAGDQVLAAGGERLQRTLDLGALRRNCNKRAASYVQPFRTKSTVSLRYKRI